MKFIPIKTRAFLPPKDDIYELMDRHLPKLREGDILVITSKILGIHQGRCVPIVKNTREEKLSLSKKESDYSIPKKYLNKYEFNLTIKDSTLVSNAGIDKSNSNGYYVMWPKNNQKLIKEIRKYLLQKNKIRKLGLISVDSHLMPLRSGTIGTATGFCGFSPIIDVRGKKDIFGQKLKVTKINIPDSLASMANFLMGEAAEQTPFLLIRGLKNIHFTDRANYKKWLTKIEYDIYAPLLKVFKKNDKVYSNRRRINRRPNHAGR